MSSVPRRATILSIFMLSVMSFTSMSQSLPVAKPLQRIISLAPHTTELAFSAGLGDKLVGVSELSDYPAAAKSIEVVANYQSIKLERILALQPDLIIAWQHGSYPRELQQLQQFGIPVYYSAISDLSDIATNIEILSQWAENPQIGQHKATQFRHQLQQIKQQYQHSQPVKFFYQLSDQPLMTVAGNHWPSDIFQVCGGQNIFQHSSAPYPQVNQEQVINAQPQVIFTSHMASSQAQMWQAWQEQIPAVKQQFIWPLNADWLNRPTMRSLKAIQQVCDYLQQARRNQ